MVARLNGCATPGSLLGCTTMEMDPFFANFFNLGAPATPQAAQKFPALNIWEDAQAYYVEAQVPGLSMEQIELQVEEGELVLKGERKFPEREGATWHLRELGEGAFERKLRLPDDADAAKAMATLANGILRIELPKHERAKPRKIEIKGVE